jgi:hypothetical protein
MMNALEVTGKVFHLPALIGTNLLALVAAGGTRPLSAIQFVDVRAYREVFEVGKMAPALARLNPSQLLSWLGMRRNVVRVERFAVQFFGRAEQQLRQLGCRLQPVCARAILLPLVAIQARPANADFRCADRLAHATARQPWPFGGTFHTGDP